MSSTTPPSPPTLPTPSPETVEAIRARVHGSLSPVKPLAPPWRRALWVLVVGAATAVALALRHGLVALSAGRVAADGGAVLAAATAGYVSSSLAVPGRGPGRALRGATLALPLGFATVVLARGPEAGGVGPAGCLATGLAVALPAAAIAFRLVAKGYATSPVAAGGAAALSAAFCGLLAVQLTCPMLTTAHLLLFHGGILAVALAAGLALGATWLKAKQTEERISTEVGGRR